MTSRRETTHRLAQRDFALEVAAVELTSPPISRAEVRRQRSP